MQKEINIIENGYMGSQISALYILKGYNVNIFYNKNKNLKNLESNLKLLQKYLIKSINKNFKFFDDLNKIKISYNWMH